MDSTQANLFGSTPCLPDPMIWPTNVTCDVAKSHFSSFGVKPASRMVDKNTDVHALSVPPSDLKT